MGYVKGWYKYVEKGSLIIFLTNEHDKSVSDVSLSHPITAVS